MERKVFTQGVGRLDQFTLNNMNRAADQVNNQAPAWAPSGPLGPFMALINPPSGEPAKVEAETAGADPVPFKWSYDWVPLAPVKAKDSDDKTLLDANSGCYQSQSTVTKGVTTALNLCELNNSPTVQMGVATSNLPDGITLQPVPESTHAMVWVYPIGLGSGDEDEFGAEGYVAYFSYTNQFDGDCE